jgi:hypothetical protein
MLAKRKADRKREKAAGLAPQPARAAGFSPPLNGGWGEPCRPFTKILSIFVRK